MTPDQQALFETLKKIEDDKAEANARNDQISADIEKLEAQLAAALAATKASAPSPAGEAVPPSTSEAQSSAPSAEPSHGEPTIPTSEPIAAPPPTPELTQKELERIKAEIATSVERLKKNCNENYQKLLSRLDAILENGWVFSDQYQYLVELLNHIFSGQEFANHYDPQAITQENVLSTLYFYVEQEKNSNKFLALLQAEVTKLEQAAAAKAGEPAKAAAEGAEGGTEVPPKGGGTGGESIILPGKPIAEPSPPTHELTPEELENIKAEIAANVERLKENSSELFNTLLPRLNQILGNDWKDQYSELNELCWRIINSVAEDNYDPQAIIQENAESDRLFYQDQERNSNEALAALQTRVVELEKEAAVAAESTEAAAEGAEGEKKVPPEEEGTGEPEDRSRASTPGDKKPDEKEQKSAPTKQEEERKALEQKIIDSIKGGNMQIAVAQAKIGKMSVGGKADTSLFTSRLAGINEELKKIESRLFDSSGAIKTELKDEALKADLAQLDELFGDASKIHRLLADIANAEPKTTGWHDKQKDADAKSAHGAGTGKAGKAPSAGRRPGKQESDSEEDRRNRLRTDIISQCDRIYDYKSNTDRILQYIKSKIGDDLKNDKEIFDAGRSILLCHNQAIAHRTNVITESNLVTLATMKQDLLSWTTIVENAMKVLIAKETELKRGEARQARAAAEPERKKMSEELQTLKKAYEAAKKEYDKFFGVVSFFKRFIKKDSTAKDKLDVARGKYEGKLKEYTAQYLDELLQQRIADTNEVVKEAQPYFNIYEHWKKFGLARLGISGALLGVGLFLGAGSEAQAVMNARQLLGGTSVGFGLYGLLSWGKDALREKIGSLKNLDAEAIGKLKEKELLQYIAAREVYATQRNIDIATDGVYIALLEGLQNLTAHHIESLIEAKFDEVNKQFKQMRIADNTVNAFLIAGSAAFGVATGLGLVSQLLDGSAKAIEESNKAIEATQKVAKMARETIAKTVQTATEAAQSGLTDSGLTADQVNTVKEQAGAAAKKAAEKAWKNVGENKNLVENSESAKQAAEAAGKQAAQEVIEAAKKEAALAAGKGASEAAGQAAADAAFQKLSHTDQLAQVNKLINDAATAADPQALDKALNDIARERVANKEFKTLAVALKDAKADYNTRVMGEYQQHLLSLVSDVTNNKPIKLNQFKELRNIASWHGTPVGDAAHKLLLYVENNRVLENNNIAEVKITKNTSIYEAFKQAENARGVDARKIDFDFATFLEQHGIDALNAKDAINQDVLTAAKKIPMSSIGEHLWYSKDGIILSQEHELLKNVDISDEGVKTEADTQQNDAEKPKKKLMGKNAPSAHTTPTPAPEASPAVLQANLVDVTVSTAGMEKTGMSNLVQKIVSLKDLAEYDFITINNFPNEFLDAVFPVLQRSFPELYDANMQAQVLTAITNEHSEKNIKALFEAKLSTIKTPITLLGERFKDGKIIIEPK